MDQLEEEVLLYLYSLNTFSTANRITAAINPPFSYIKQKEIENILIHLSENGFIIQKKLPFIDSLGWQYNADSDKDIKISQKTFKKFIERNINTEKILKKILSDYICSSSGQTTLNKIISYFDFLELETKITNQSIQRILALLEQDNKITKERFNNAGILAWRKFDILTDRYLDNEEASRKKLIPIPSYHEIDIPLHDFSTSPTEYLNKKTNDLKCSIDKIRHISKEDAGILSSGEGELAFASLTEVSCEVASIFANSKKRILLPGLKKFPDTPEHIKLAEKILLQDKSIYEVDRFSVADELGFKVASILRKNNRGLHLFGIKKLSNKLAAELSRHSNPNFRKLCRSVNDDKDALSWLSSYYDELVDEGFFDLKLESLTELLDEPGHILLAKKLASQKTIFLPCLKKLSASCASEISKSKGNIYLNGISSLPAKIADILSETKAVLSLESLTELNDSISHLKIAKKLAIQGNVNLPRLKRISQSAAIALAKCEGLLNLQTLSSISDSVALELSKHNGFLKADSITPLSSRPAHILLGIKILNQFEEDQIDDNLNSIFDIDENHLKHPFFKRRKITINKAIISEQFAFALSNHDGIIDLESLENASDAHIQIFHRYALQDYVHLPNLNSITPLVASALSSSFEVRLDGLKNINTDVAIELCKNQGVLSLNGLTSLDDSVAMYLSKHSGYIFLNGLLKMSDKPGFIALAEKLSAQDSIELESLVYLSKKTALVISNCHGDIHLPYKILGNSIEHLALRRKISAQTVRKSYLF